MTLPQGSSSPSCASCQTAFRSRNALFRHLRENATCAANGGLTSFEAQQPLPVGEIIDNDILAGKKVVIAPLHRQPKPCPNLPHKKAKDQVKRHGLNTATRPQSYAAELRAKVLEMEALFITNEVDNADGPQLLPQTEVFASEVEHFRMKAEFDICRNWNNAGPAYVMWDGKDRVHITDYPMADRRISEVLMPKLLSALHKEEALMNQIFQVNFHTTLYGEAMVALLYRTPYDRKGQQLRKERQREANENGLPWDDTDMGPLTADWEAAAQRLQADIGRGASIVGHIRGRTRVVGHDWIEEQLHVVGVAAPLRYRQPEGFFSQSNGRVAQHMLAWARAVARADDAVVGSSGEPREDDLLELYCGNGNFAIALASCFRRVLATELVKVLVDAARQNAIDNNIDNVAVARVSSEELAQALEGTRTFQRLSHVDLGTYNLGTVLVDPPRAGLGEDVASCLTGFERIVYISCNPETLHKDLQVLRRTHEIKRVAAFDQFPYTEHLEAGVLLVRRQPSREWKPAVIVGATSRAIVAVHAKESNSAWQRLLLYGVACGSVLMLMRSFFVGSPIRRRLGL